jgi:sugar-specific transcriptional regulator TrmB
LTQDGDDPLDILTQLGLSPNESKVYIAFLRESPATPYRIAKEAGIPLNKVYEVVQRLVSRAFIAEVEGSDGGYVAKEPGAALTDMADRFRATAETAAQKLEMIRRGRKHYLAWNVEGRDEVVLHGRQIITRCVSHVTVAAPARLVDEWLPDLTARATDGVRVKLLSVTRPPSLPSTCDWHRLSPASSIQVLKAGAVVTADERIVLFASADAQAHSYQGSWTENKVIVAMADEFVSSLVFIEDVFENQWIPWGES